MFLMEILIFDGSTIKKNLHFPPCNYSSSPVEIIEQRQRANSPRRFSNAILID